MRSKGWLRIMKELNWPPIFLIPPRQFSMLDGEDNKEDNSINNKVWGLSATEYPVIALHPDLTGKVLDNTIYHEIAHHLWPWKPHWWIDVFGEKMARGGGRGYWANREGKTPDDIPDRDQLLIMARRQAEKLKQRYRIRQLRPR